MIKSPKYYFLEPGLLTYLLDIEKPEQVSRDPLMGCLFENLVVVEALNARYNKGMTANLYFFRDSHGNEIDLLHRTGGSLLGMEIKAAATWHSSFKTALKRFSDNTHPLQGKFVAYRGRRLSFEDGAEIRHEYIDGELYAMTGASRSHGLITLNLATFLRPQLRGTPCQLFANDMKVRLRIADQDFFYYPDLVLSCDADDRAACYCTAPDLLVD